MSAIRPRHARFSASLTALALLALLAAACGGAVPSAAPTTAPTPLVTANPHLGSAATAQEVFNGLGRAGLKITPNTATAGPQGGDIITRINATYLGWPLDLTEYRTTRALAVATERWEAGEAPGRGEPPIALLGVNILVTWGPRTTGEEPGAPDERQAKALNDLVAALEPLLAPLRTRTVVPVKLAATPPTTPAATPAPSNATTATPAP